MEFLKRVTITLSFLSTLYGMEIQDPTRPCSLLQNSLGFSTVLLQNDPVFLGWFELTNTTNYPVRLVNSYKREFFYTLAPYERKSFNYRGTQEVLCYRPLSENSIDRSTDTQINCSDVINVSKCYRAADTIRSQTLGLE
jgi:hypothetical protein